MGGGRGSVMNIHKNDHYDQPLDKGKGGWEGGKGSMRNIHKHGHYNRSLDRTGVGEGGRRWSGGWRGGRGEVMNINKNGHYESTTRFVNGHYDWPSDR